MRVDENSNFTTIKNQVEEVYTALVNINSEYNGSVDSLNLALTGIDFGTWQDDVSTKLQQCLEKTKTDGVSKIQQDLSGGGFKQLLDKVKEVLSKVKSAKTKKSDISAKESAKSKLPPKVKVGNSMVDNYEIQLMADQISGMKKELRKLCDNINILLIQIEQIKFDGTVSNDYTGGYESSYNPKADLQETKDSQDHWTHPTQFLPGDAKYSFYDYTTSSGEQVTICVRKGQPVYYRTGSGQECTYYDANFNEISQAEADALAHASNSW